MSPLHSVDSCPVCGGGLLGIRLCHGNVRQGGDLASPHGLVICDECEAIWTEPDSQTAHQYPAAEDARCPICETQLWNGSHWAGRDEVARLGWSEAVNSTLDVPATDASL